jgi:hypothetical protein
MKTVFEAILTHSNQMVSENRQLYTSLRKAYERLEKEHASSEWATQPMPALATYREKLKQYSSHSVQVVNEADFTISVRPVH